MPYVTSAGTQIYWEEAGRPIRPTFRATRCS